ncbi:MAG: DUF4038 domain-containing protein [Fimbriimonadaceae bacterium]|nr:DUF4038 domain-containing protein [Fimbriimonadaceae bacterium]
MPTLSVSKTESPLTVGETFSFTFVSDEPLAPNPFADVIITATFGGIPVNGFCDDPTGQTFTVRFRPDEPGPVSYSVRLQAANTTVEYNGTFDVQEAPADAPYEGPLDVEGEIFRYRRSRRAFVWNSFTAYMLMGLSPTARTAALQSFADSGVTRLRVSLTPSRQLSGARWDEPNVVESPDFTFRYGPFLCANPDDTLNPGSDPTRFDPDYFQRFEAMLTEARALGIHVQVVCFTDAQEDQNYPFDRDSTADPNERRFYEYVIARLASFPNVEWCITNEWALFRPDEWVNAIGEIFRTQDPYRQLCSVHGHGRFPFAAQPWCTHTLFQIWDEHGGPRWGKRIRAEWAAQGTVGPIVNEEFGYEDHGPTQWGEGRPRAARSAEALSRQLWELFMVGIHATTGDSPVSSNGGWVNGAGVPPTAPLRRRHQIWTEFLARFDWPRTVPTDGLADGDAYVRAIESELYVVYVPNGGTHAVRLPNSGPWTVDAFDPATGTVTRLATDATLTLDPYAGPGFLTPTRPFGVAWAYLIRA